MLLTRAQMEQIQARAGRDYSCERMGSEQSLVLAMNDVHNLLAHIDELEKYNGQR